MKPSLPANPRVAVNSEFDRRFGLAAFALLLLVLLLSTYLHHFQPQVLKVPSNVDATSWKNPTLEQTLLDEQMTPEAKDTLLKRGVPMGQSLSALIVADLFTALLAWLCFAHALKNYGFWMASLFLIGSFVFTGLEESLWILSGRFLGGLVNNPFGEPAFGSYWFTRGGLWFIETPVVACLGWFFIAYSCVLTASKVFPNRGFWWRATVGGLIAMGIDLWQDPVQTAPEIMAWVWGKADFLLLFGIPHYNFLGWFLLIAVFAVLWEKLPLMEQARGRPAATTRFLLQIFLIPFAILIGIWVWLLLLGYLLSLLGFQQAIHIPAGW